MIVENYLYTRQFIIYRERVSRELKRSEDFFNQIDSYISIITYLHGASILFIFSILFAKCLYYILRI